MNKLIFIPIVILIGIAIDCLSVKALKYFSIIQMKGGKNK